MNIRCTSNRTNSPRMDFWGHLVHMILLEIREVIATKTKTKTKKWVQPELIQKLECQLTNLKWEIYPETENKRDSHLNQGSCPEGSALRTQKRWQGFDPLPKGLVSLEGRFPQSVVADTLLFFRNMSGWRIRPHCWGNFLSRKNTGGTLVCSSF